MGPMKLNNNAATVEEFQWTDWFWAVLVCVLFLLPGLTYGETERVAYPIQMVTGAQQTHPSTVQIQARTLFPNACFRADLNGGRLRDRQTIELVQYALVTDGHCTQKMEATGLTVQLERPDDGTYHILDALDQRFLGVLEVRDGVAQLIPKEEL
ncbi:MAG: hypothetical protein KF767_06895 [Bdellovibrionaceae bacterium]|nr:hypothetical protein [Pseudobdellovibrionaceae bacterium]